MNIFEFVGLRQTGSLTSVLDLSSNQYFDCHGFQSMSDYPVKVIKASTQNNGFRLVEMVFDPIHKSICWFSIIFIMFYFIVHDHA